MKALVKTAPAPGHVEFLDWPDPHPGPSEVLIAVERAGVCGTDLSMYDWNRLIVEGYNPTLPVVMGHEFAGVVVEVGWEVVGLRHGDHVTVNPALTCGHCRFCRAEQSMLCADRRLVGLQAQGVFAEYAVAPVGNVYRVPAELPWDLAAVAEPFAVALHALEKVDIFPGSTVAVVGPGSIGICLLAALKLTPAARIIMVGLEADRERLAVAASMGASVAIIGSESPKQVVLDLTDGLGADVSFETAGHPQATALATELTRKGGRIGLLGLPHDLAPLNSAALALAEKQLIGVRAYDVSTWRSVAPLLERASADLSRVVTHRVPMRDFEHAVELTRSRRGLKVLLTPGN